MSSRLERDVRIYNSMTERIGDFDDWLEVENLLIWRDSIRDELDKTGPEISEESKQMLASADKRLAEAASTISRRFPVIFEESQAIAKERWWWHLNEGPQVREEAEKRKVA